MSYKAIIILFFLLSPIMLVFLLTFKKDKYNLKKVAFENQLWNCHDVLLLLTIVLASMFLMTYLFRSFHYKSIIYLLSSVIINGSIVFFVLRYKYNLSLYALSYNKQAIGKDILLGLKVFLLFEVFRFAVVLVSHRESLLFDFSKIYCIKYSGFEFLLFIVLVVLIVPVVEEVVFRGFMFAPIARKIGRIGSFFLTSYIWASFHGYNHVLSLMLLGFVLVYLYEKTESLMPNITLHILTNSSRFVMYYYSKMFEKSPHIIEPRSFLVLLTLIFSVCFVVLVILSKTRIFQSTKRKRA